MNQTENGSRGYLFGIVMVAVLGGLLFGYDTAVISGAEKGLQAFFLGANDFAYTDFMHGFTSSSALIGCIIGSALSGVLASNLGRKRSLIIAGLLFFVSALGSMAPEFLLFECGVPTYSLLIVFNVYRVIGGIGVGLASAICPMYIGEVAPSNIRGMLVSWNQFAIIFGQLMVYFVNFLILGDHTTPVIEQIGHGVNRVVAGSDPWTIATGWRYMFGSEAVPAGLFALLICFVPETPRYLVMVGRDSQALSVLSKINGKSRAAEILSDIRQTITVRTERLFTYGYLCIFVGIMLSVFQQVVGINAVLYYAPRIFGDMGMTNPMVNTVVMGVVNILFTLVAVFTVEKLGRKPLLICGSVGMAAGAFGVALSFGHAGLEMVTMLSIMVYSASFMFSWGPITWVLIAEIFPNTIRGKAVAIAVAFQWIFNFIVSSTFLPMFNMHLTEGDDFGHWFTYGLYGVICLLAALFVWRLVPETKGKTLEDMTTLWKPRRCAVLLCLLVFIPLSAQQKSADTGHYVSQVWCPDNGDGTYTNPVINADYSDPDVCVGASGEDYYLTASSFQCSPGLPILHSRDLVNWEFIGHAVRQLEPRKVFDRPAHGMGVWAPSIRYHDGWYYIYWGDPDYGVMMVRTQDPAGEWEAPVCVVPGKGMIDTTPLWDDDGRCYLVNAWANSRSKFASVLTVRELSADGTRVIGEPVIVFDGNGNENRTCEGGKFYKRDGWYWILCPAGGVPSGFQLAMRSHSPYGPYEHKIVLSQGKTAINGPHQGGWVHTKYGEDWFMHFQDKEAYGRVVHLQPVDWSSGWPVMGRKGEPVTTYRKPKSSADGRDAIVNPAESDEFDSPKLGLQWQWHANYDQYFGMPTSFGTMRIYTHKLDEGWKSLWEVPNLLLQKTPADEFTVTAKLRLTAKAEGQMGGLIMMGLDYSALVVRRVGQEFQLVQMTCKDADRGREQSESVLATLKPTAADHIDYKPAIHEDIYLRLRVSNAEAGVAHGGKPMVTFSYSKDGRKFVACGKPFAMRQGKWIGAKFGFVAAETNAKADRGWVEADWIRVTR